MRMFGVIPFIKLQNDTEQLNGEKRWKMRDWELNHLSVFVLPSAWKNETKTWAVTQINTRCINSTKGTRSKFNHNYGRSSEAGLISPGNRICRCSAEAGLNLLVRARGFFVLILLQRFQIVFCVNVTNLKQNEAKSARAESKSKRDN